MQEIIYNKGWNLISFIENYNLNEIIIYFQGKYIEQTLYSSTANGYENITDNVEIKKGYCRFFPFKLAHATCRG